MGCGNAKEGEFPGQYEQHYRVVIILYRRGLPKHRVTQADAVLRIWNTSNPPEKVLETNQTLIIFLLVVPRAD